MKRIQLPCLTLLLLLLSGCSTEQNQYKIEGIAENIEGKMVYLIEQSKNEKVDSMVVKEGRFSFTGAVERPTFYSIAHFRDEQWESSSISSFVLEEGVIEITLPENQRAIVKGTPLNQKRNVFLTDQDKINEEVINYRNSLQNQDYGNEEILALVNEFAVNQKIQERQIESRKEYFKANLESVLAIEVLETLTYSLSDEELFELASLLKGELAEHQLVKNSKLQRELAVATAEGELFTDFVIESTAHGKQSLSTYVGNGKYVLVDFWASWCAPCLAELPHLKQIYTEYKGEQFEMLGVAVADKLESSQKTVEEHQLPWPQILDAQRVPLDIYGIKEIPYLILFSPDGTILKRGFTTADLRVLLNDLLQ